MNSKMSGHETTWLVMLTLAAGLLRWLHLEQSSLSHFDEGVYALWGLAGDYPSKEFFAPPLFPWLIRAISVVMGPSDLVPQLLSALFGAATVPAVWWISRRCFGPTAAVASASMATFSGLHIAFSRLALTDSTFTFWFVLSVGLIAQALGINCQSNGGSQNGADSSTTTRGTGNDRSAWVFAIAAGVSAGAALNTKYNGLLVLAIA